MQCLVGSLPSVPDRTIGHGHYQVSVRRIPLLRGTQGSKARSTKTLQDNYFLRRVADDQHSDALDAVSLPDGFVVTGQMEELLVMNEANSESPPESKFPAAATSHVYTISTLFTIDSEFQLSSTHRVVQASKSVRAMQIEKLDSNACTGVTKPSDVIQAPVDSRPSFECGHCPKL